MKRFGLLALATSAMVGFVSPTTQLLTNDAAKSTAMTISSERLRDFLTFIADDALQGRDTPSPGLDAAANFIAYNLKSWGLKPAGDNGTYFQNIRLERTTYDKAASKVTAGDVSLGYLKDFLVMTAAPKVSGEIVYVGLKGETHDYKGKIVLIGRQAMQDAQKIASGSPAAVIYDSGQSSSGWPAYVDGFTRFGGGFQMPGAPAEEGKTNPTLLTLSGDGFKALAKKAGTSATIEITATKEYAWTRNVCATLEGSDPVLKNEYVAFGAHYDHVGMDPNKPGPDKIYNGADDDGSGTVSILNIAEAAAKSSAKPKRSFLFVWHCGEEKGLWGSDYYTKHMTVPKGSVVAQLNIDMIGRSKKDGDTNPRNKELTGPNAIYVIGTTMMSTRLGEIVHGVNKSYLQIDYDKRYDDPKDPNQFFYRSDHYNYARNGIPICFWFDGEHEDYHQVGDEVSKIDFAKMEKIVRTVYLTGVTVANEAVRPPVDKPLNR